MNNAYLPLTEDVREEMLHSIGKSSIDELLENVPKEVRTNGLDIPSSLSEYELERELADKIEDLSKGSPYHSFLGAGVYQHFIPSIVPVLSSRGEFLTAYTPYQPEASQGTLQCIYEYQTMIANLYGMEVSNASHYDGATSMAESVLIAVQHTRRNEVILSSTVHPEYREVIKTYLNLFGCEVKEIPYSSDTGEVDKEKLFSFLSDKTACFVSQSPNFFGVIEDYSDVRGALDAVNALWVYGANPISLGVVKTPGEWGADLACGEGQPLGLSPSFGGPFLGIMTASQKLIRKMPGRLAGQTVDMDGKRSFVLTLQAREQHIRRQRASSNICTNQGLCMLRACIYMVSLGETGFQRISHLNLSNAAYLRSQLSQLPNVQIHFSSPSFNEMVVSFKKPFSEVNSQLKKKGILFGVELEKFYPELKDTALICVTELKRKKDIDSFLSVLEREVL